jgi:hypothetical protein
MIFCSISVFPISGPICSLRMALAGTNVRTAAGAGHEQKHAGFLHIESGGLHRERIAVDEFQRDRLLLRRPDHVAAALDFHDIGASLEDQRTIEP